MISISGKERARAIEIPPLKPAQVNIKISPFSFFIIGFNKFNGIETANSLAVTATKTHIILIPKILRSEDKTITSKPIKTKQLQSGAQLFYDVFKEHEPDNLLYQQAINETFDHGIESPRIQRSFEKIEKLKIIWKDCKYPTPFSFPLITDRIRSKISSESVEDRIRKMYLQLEKSVK